MVALVWIQSDVHRWKQFVANRVTQIQELTGREHWAHCPGKENPADLVTRGLFAEQLVASEVWLKGPKFIRDRSGNLEITTGLAGVEQNVLSRPHTINLYDGVGQLTDYRRSVDSLSGSFQLDFVVYDASDGFRRRPIRFKK